MSKFYGTVKGRAKSAATREGNDSIRVSAQSWDNSIVVEMSYRYGNSGVLDIEIGCMEGSKSSFSVPTWSGSYEEFEAMCERDMQRRS